MSFQKYVLQIKIVDENLRPHYEAAVAKTQTEEYLLNPHKDSGFDLFIPMAPPGVPRKAPLPAVMNHKPTAAQLQLCGCENEDIFNEKRAKMLGWVNHTDFMLNVGQRESDDAKILEALAVVPEDKIKFPMIKRVIPREVPMHDDHNVGRDKDGDFIGDHQVWREGSKLIDLGIQCAAYHYIIPTMKVPVPQAFYVYPRSSIYKSNVRLANNVGIIDSGYRGNLKAAFDVYGPDKVSIPPITRLLQICMPNLSPFQIVIVDELDETSRGEGGFGSTGK